MTTMTLECEAFTATPISEGRIRLDIKAAAAPRKTVYSSGEAAVRLGEILGRTLTPGGLAHWRRKGLPHVRLGTKKIVYCEDEILKWAQGKTTYAIP